MSDHRILYAALALAGCATLPGAATIETTDTTKENHPMQAPVTIPADQLAKRLADLDEGESAWTVPWAMHVTSEGRAYLNTRYTQSSGPGGTVQLEVTRLESGWKTKLHNGYEFLTDDSPPPAGFEPVTIFTH